jgi:glycerol-3-phosphate acyltransferase PlsY
MLVILPLAVLLAAPVFIIVIVVTRYVSLGSLLAAVALVFWVTVLWVATNGAFPVAYPIYAAVGAGLIWLAHADNIERLLHGKERKFDLGMLGGRRQEG